MDILIGAYALFCMLYVSCKFIFWLLDKVGCPNPFVTVFDGLKTVFGREEPAPDVETLPPTCTLEVEWDEERYAITVVDIFKHYYSHENIRKIRVEHAGDTVSPHILYRDVNEQEYSVILNAIVDIKEN